MLPRTLLSATLATSLLATGAHAQVVVDFRIVERTGQTVASPFDNILNLAIQARVNSPGNTFGLSGWYSSMVMTGEPETSGTLSRDRTSEADRTYSTAIAGGGGGSFVGLPAQYTYLSGLDARFNGVINSSGGSWVQGPYQDIGLAYGQTAGTSLLSTPGVDPDGDGVPNGSTVAGPYGPTVTLPASIMAEYFGAGQWVDIYRFRYVLSDFTPRTLNFNVRGDTNLPIPGAYLFSTVHAVDGVWGDLSPNRPLATVSNLQILTVGVIPGPGGVAVGMIGVGVLMRRRR
jgi:hypothetical protein